MSAKKSMDTDDTSLTNIRIKTERIEIEPGTSTNTALVKNIKTEPGLPASTRLPSFRVPRDLTLGGNVKLEKPKKIYTPNINVQRNKKKDEGGAGTNDSKQTKSRGRGRGHSERGRGRGKTPSNLIQSTGVFSEGLCNQAKARRSGSGYRESNSDDKRDTRSHMEKPVLNLNHKVDKAEEEKKLQTLLRDDFIDDGTENVQDFDAPITLPLMDKVKVRKSETKMEVTVNDAPEDEEIDVKPIILANGDAVLPTKSVRVKAPKVQVKADIADSTIQHSIENPLNGYMLIQFPDCLPGLPASDDSTDPRAKRHSEKQTSPESESTKSEYCTLGSLKGGMLGKIQICKSGKVRLIIGDNNMIVDLGSRVSFRQDLVAVKLEPDNSGGELINLGKVNNSLICSPDWESMLSG